MSKGTKTPLEITTKSKISPPILKRIEQLYADGYIKVKVHEMILAELPEGAPHIPYSAVSRYIEKVKAHHKEEKELMRTAFQQAAISSATSQIAAISELQFQVIELTRAAYKDGDIKKQAVGIDSFTKLVRLQHEMADPSSDNLKAAATIVVNQYGESHIEQLLKTFQLDRSKGNPMLDAEYEEIETVPERDDETE